MEYDVREATIRAFSEAAYGTDAIATRADQFLREFEVRPRGTVTEAEVDAAYAVLRGIAPREWARRALEAAREAK